MSYFTFHSCLEQVISELRTETQFPASWMQLFSVLATDLLARQMPHLAQLTKLKH